MPLSILIVTSLRRGGLVGKSTKLVYAMFV
jgi:hypothetical protein